jgi:excisionase family DNA binding protein
MADAHKPCLICGETDPEKFYRTVSHCKQCHKRWNLAYRKKPGLREKVREAKNRWLKAHPEVNQKNVAAHRERHPKARWAPPPTMVTATQAAKLLGVSRQYIHQLIDEEKLADRGEGRLILIDRADVERLLAERQRDS